MPPNERDPQERPAKNTDRELWREPPGDYYANSIRVTEDGGIGIDVGGMVIVKTLAKWHALAKDPAPTPIERPAELQDAAYERDTAIHRAYAQEVLMFQFQKMVKALEAENAELRKVMQEADMLIKGLPRALSEHSVEVIFLQKAIDAARGGSDE